MEKLEFYPVTSEWQKQMALEFNFKIVKRLRPCQSKQFGSKQVPTNCKSILPDGNCLFATFSFSLTGTPEQHGLIRTMITDYMIKRHNELNISSNYVSTTEMNKIGTWGTDIEIQVAANMFRTRVYVYSLYGGSFKWLRFEPNQFSRRDFDESIYIRHCSYAPKSSHNCLNHFKPVLDI